MGAERDREPEPELAGDPGRPRGRDEIDPELVHLPRSRARIGPVLAVSVLIFCGYFMVRLRSDLVFAMRSDDPDQVSGIAAALEADIDSYVELRAVPDRAAMLRAYASDARDGHRLAPALGSGDRLWIMFAGSHWGEPPAYAEVVRGRVKRAGDLPFHDDLVAELERSRWPRAIQVDAAARALAARAPRVEDVAGDSFPVSPEAPVTLVERVVGEARVTGFATDGQPDQRAWRAALERAGVLASGAPLESRTEASWSFRVPAERGVEPVAAALVSARLYAARAEPVDRTVRASWGALGVAGADFAITSGGGSPERVPRAGVRALLVDAPRAASPDARVIVTTEAPGDYWYVLPLYIVLAGFGLLFGWALVRSVVPARDRIAEVKRS